MSANASTRVTWRSYRIAWLVAAVVLCVLLLQALGIAKGGFLTAYAALALATSVVLRSVSREPGSWLGRRGVRRALVVMLGADCVTLLLGGLWWPSSIAVWTLFILLLILFNIALGRATQRVATAPDATVDERQEALRNRAHVVSYRLLMTVLVLVLLTGVATPQTRSWLGHSLSFGFAGYLQLLFGLPAMVLAWIEPDRLAPESEPRVADLWAALSIPLLVLTIAVPFLVSLAFAFLPVHTTSSMSPPAAGYPKPGTTSGPIQCRGFFAHASVGAGVEAEIPLNAEACWDGRHAYEVYGMNPGSDCHFNQSMLTTVTTAGCTRTTGADGSLHFTYRAAVRPALLPFLVRDLEVSVVLDRNGHVERFP